jgi:pyruvate, orthophosphate dikinase
MKDALVNKRLVTAAEPIAHGTCASSGIAVGRAALDSDRASRFAVDGEPVILVRPDTTTADVAGFATAAGIVTAVGGPTAHAALVARQMGKPCIVGCTALSIDPAAHTAQLAGTTINEGDWLSIGDEAGAIYLGRGDVLAERPEAELAEVERWRAVAA